jgi:hypothetical protein
VRLPVVTRAQLAAWRGQARRIRARSGRTITSVLLVVAGLAGALGGGALVGRWCLGVVLIAESAGAVWVGLNRDDGQPAAVRGARTVGQVLEDERMRP